MELLIAILVAFGITNIVTQSSIFYPMREWLGKNINDPDFGKLSKFFYKLVNCPMCFGFWVGILVGAVVGPFPFWNVIFNGALYSGTCWIIFCLTQFLGQGNDPNRTINVLFQNELPHKDINTDSDSSKKD